MKLKLFFLTLLLTNILVANIKVDVSSKLIYVTEDTVIDGLDQNTDEGVIFVTLSMHIEKGARVKVRNACLIIQGSLTGTGFIDVDESATVTLEGDEEGRITFLNRFLADDTCQQDTDKKILKNIKDVPQGLNYSLYNMSGRLLDKGQIDDYIQNYRDPKKYFIKVEGYRLKKIIFKG
ncbi:hypothetical protein [Aquimarina rhabdastrellae]